MQEQVGGVPGRGLRASAGRRAGGEVHAATRAEIRAARVEMHACVHGCGAAPCPPTAFRPPRRSAWCCGTWPTRSPCTAMTLRCASVQRFVFACVCVCKGSAHSAMCVREVWRGRRGPTPPSHAVHPPPQGDAKRLLLASLTKSLSEVLPFLERMLEHNFAAAGAAVQAGSRDTAQQHVLVIQAALAAANTYSGGVGGRVCCAVPCCGGAAGWRAGQGCVAATTAPQQPHPWRCAALPQSGCRWEGSRMPASSTPAASCSTPRSSGTQPAT